MSGVAFIIQIYDGPEVLQWLAFGLAYLTLCVGLALFTANIIQYIIDQLVGASADELNTVIYWHCAALPLKSLFLSVATYFNTYGYFNLIMFILSGVAISLILVSHSFFKQKLENISLIKNPIKLIVRVLCYARKHKYPENHSALTYWEEEAPSRLDLGKNKYGGPFTVEEIEDVKTVFRIIPIFIAIIGYSLSEEHYLNNDNNTSFLVCVLSNNALHNGCSFLLILIYLYFFRVFFYKYIPSVLRRMSFGLVFALISRIPYLLPFLNITWKEFVSQTLLGISYVLVNPVSLEFIVAQSPVQTRGVMVGIWYASWQIGRILSYFTAFLFHCGYQNICLSLYYHLTKIVLLLIILIVFVILAKRYKYRVRENEVNIYQIADDHYQRYMEQEDQYKNEENNTNNNYIVQDEQFRHNQQENNVNFDPVEQLEEFRHNQQENNINIKFNS
uniref:Major facilitator superfamily associated domain-containing protein n=1 Tax=Amphimedon queenslandica TaxID=400682 RepID=A0A1X7UK24_AMPQE